MTEQKRNTIVLAIVAGGIVLGSGYFLFGSTKVPTEFSEARANGASIANQIVEQSRVTLANLSRISEFDRDFNYSEALLLISNELVKNRESSQDAIRLSSQLERMARTSGDIRPSKAREVATEGLSSEVALVSRLVVYNDLLKQLFEVLRQKFEKPWINLDGQVQSLITKINDEAQAINDFNKRFVAAMVSFDDIIAK